MPQDAQKRNLLGLMKQARSDVCRTSTDHRCRIIASDQQKLLRQGWRQLDDDIHDGKALRQTSRCE